MSRIFCQNVLSIFTAFGIYLRLDYRHAILFIFIVQLSDQFWSVSVPENPRIGKARNLRRPVNGSPIKEKLINSEFHLCDKSI